jgi:hypothetical protein
MRKLLNNPWLVALVAAVALLMVGNSVRSALSGPAPVSALPAAAVAPEEAPGEAAAEDEAVAQVSMREALASLAIPPQVRDPFAARSQPGGVNELSAEPDQVDRVRLSAIWTQDNATLVLINERICEPGDEIGRLKIESATQEGVWFTHWKGRDFLPLGAEFVLNTPASSGHAVAPSTQAL